MCRKDLLLVKRNEKEMLLWTPEHRFKAENCVWRCAHTYAFHSFIHLKSTAFNLPHNKLRQIAALLLFVGCQPEVCVVILINMAPSSVYACDCSQENTPTLCLPIIMLIRRQWMFGLLHLHVGHIAWFNVEFSSFYARLCNTDGFDKNVAHFLTAFVENHILVPVTKLSTSNDASPTCVL